MCNINIIFKKNKKQSSKLAEYMNYASWNSWLENRDGEGYIALSDRGLEVGKGLDKMRYSQSYWFLSTHQRLATTGLNAGNTHPHETKHLLIQHNGILSGLGNTNDSDTKEYVDMLEKSYVKCGNNFVRAVQALHPKISGSYSIVAYEKSSGKAYYFKESWTKMYRIEDSKYLVMSTEAENLKFAQWFLKIEGNIKEMKSFRIFDIFNGLQPLGKFKEKKYNYYKGYSYDDDDEWLPMFNGDIVKKSEVSDMPHYYSGKYY